MPSLIDPPLRLNTEGIGQVGIDDVSTPLEAVLAVFFYISIRINFHCKQNYPVRDFARDTRRQQTRQVHKTTSANTNYHNFYVKISSRLTRHDLTREMFSFIRSKIAFVSIFVVFPFSVRFVALNTIIGASKQ